MLTEARINQALSAPLDAIVPVACDFTGDTETPVSAFMKLRRGGTAFLLESGERDGRLGRFSFIGTAPDAVLRASSDRGTVTTESGVRAYRGTPLEAVRELAGRDFVWSDPEVTSEPSLPRFTGGLVGAFGFDLVRSIERLPTHIPDDTGFPAALFARYHTVLAFDHLRQRLLCISLLPRASSYGDRRAAVRRAEARIESMADALRRGVAPAPMPAGDARRGSVNIHAVPDDETFLASVAKVVEHIRAGEAIQVVLSRRLESKFDGDPFELYRSLRTISPSPYMFYLEFPELSLAGCSPEMLIRIEEGVAQLSPIAGTRPRGSDAAEDAANELELLADAKERAEHVMLVDLARNDLGQVCRTGSVGVPQLMQVERFSHVMHMVSVVTGRLRSEVDALAAFAASFPAGTVSGAPRIRALELIEELEVVRRGAYAGAVAHIAPGARELDACITIRTLVARRGKVSAQVGAGIVASSEPERELAETNAKAAAMLAALGRARPAAVTDLVSEGTSRQEALT